MKLLAFAIVMFTLLHTAVPASSDELVHFVDGKKVPKISVEENGKSSWYRSRGGQVMYGGFATSPVYDATILELGMTSHSDENNWYSFGGGLSLLMLDETDYSFGGGHVEINLLELPFIISPFVGAGIYYGEAKEEDVLLKPDNKDNDGDSFIDEPGEKGTITHSVGALYGRGGVSFWFDENTVLTVDARRYFITWHGSSRKVNMYGLRIATRFGKN